MISYGKQTISEDDISAVVNVLKSDFLTQGPAVEEFEDALAKYCGVKYCVVVANGTAALHLAVSALELPKGSHGITSTNTFVASANSMLYSGLIPIFSDINPKTYNVNLDTLKKVITEKTMLFIPVHFAGQPCEMDEIKEFANSRGIKIIEDASHAIGSSYCNGDRVGSCKNSDATVFSFHPVKTITSGEGGAITTNDESLYQKLLLLRNHGITKDKKLLKNNPGPWYYEMHDIGFNYRLSDLHATLGNSQLKRIEVFKNKRRELVNRYNKAFANVPEITVPYERYGVESCFHLYVVKIDYNSWGTSRSKFMNHLFTKGIGTQVHYIPVHTQPYYIKNFNTKYQDCPNAMDYYSQALSLPLYPNLSNTEQDFITEEILKYAK